MKRSSPLRRKTRMKRVSDKRRIQNSTYSCLKVKWRSLPENQYCLARCALKKKLKSAEPYPHHIRGRDGAMLTDTRFWLPICRPCHDWIEEHREEAWNLGWLASRDRKAMKHEGLCE